MSYSSVREALPASQRWSAPSVSRQMSHESTVPSRTSSIGTPVGRWSNIQRILGAENIGSTRRPLRSCTSCRSWSLKFSSHQAVVRRSCHPITGPRAAPVPARQPTTDSRCVESAMPMILASGAPSRQAAIASSTLVQMRSASCSTQPGRGEEIPTGALTATDQLAVRADESGFRIRRPLVDCQDQLIGRNAGHRYSSHRLRAILLRCSPRAAQLVEGPHLLTVSTAARAYFCSDFDDSARMIDYAVPRMNSPQECTGFQEQDEPGLVAASSSTPTPRMRLTISSRSCMRCCHHRSTSEG